MAEITNFANLLSENDCWELKNKFPAFLSAELSEKAKKDDAWQRDDYKTGYYFTRTAKPKTLNFVVSVFFGGDIRSINNNIADSGLRICLQTKFLKDSCIAKSCKNITKTIKILNEEKMVDESITSTVPIVIFGKKEYIWLNKDECESGKEQTMRLISEKLLAKAKPFDNDGITNDYGSSAADKIRQQCEFEALEYANEEEKNLLVKVRLSGKDGYEKATPILEKKEEKTAISDLFDDLINGKIDEEGLKVGLKKIVAIERVKKDASIETAQALQKEITKQAKQFEEKLVKISKAYDKVNETIDNLCLGGKK